MYEKVTVSVPCWFILTYKADFAKQQLLSNFLVEFTLNK